MHAREESEHSMSRGGKILVVLLVIFATVGMDYLLTGWGTYPPDRAKAEVSAQLDAFKKGDPCFLTNDDAIDFSEFGITSEEDKKAYLDSFSYSLGNTHLQGDNGCRVTVHITSKQLASAFIKSFDSLLAYDTMERTQALPQDQIDAGRNQVLRDNLMNEDATNTTVEVQVVSQDDHWEITEDGKTALAQAIFGDVASVKQSLQTATQASAQ